MTRHREQRRTAIMRLSFLTLFLVLPAAVMGFTQPLAFRRPNRCHVCHSSSTTQDDDDPQPSTDDNPQDTATPPVVEAVPVDPDAVRLQKELLKIASSTNRGFDATSAERKRARELIFDLSNYNPTLEPASPYYTNETAANNDAPTLAGKWTLIYTDAPDITGLDAGGPLATAKLGRIGQECNPPFIKNVIEWRRPDWAKNLPLSGTDDSRVLQKVCTQAKASPDKPLLVNLELAGIQVVAPPSNTTTNLQEAIQEEGLPMAWFQSNPVELKGPLTAPFGQFEVLYLDDQMRIVKTGQNFLAVNVRDDEEWF